LCIVDNRQQQKGMSELSNIGFTRTALFVPGNRPDRVDKAVQTPADMVIIDLEDTVPRAEKARTRFLVREKIKAHAGRTLMVRVNSLETGFTAADLAEILIPGLDAVMLPKVQLPEDVDRVSSLLAQQETAGGIQNGSVALVSLLESALAVENAFQIASAATSFGRPHRLAFGAADFTLDLGIRMSKDAEELAYPRARIAVASRAAGIDAPLDSPFMIDLKDTDALTADTLRGKNLGFGGRLCVHPNQVDICNRIYSPDEQEVAFASRVVAAFEAAEAGGTAAIEIDGKMIDYPIVAQCRRVLEVAARIKR
jgi:citrate lyase subunit beta/citryl-CoA lyase